MAMELLDVMHVVPQLFELLPENSYKQLRAVNSKFRAIVNCKVTQIHMGPWPYKQAACECVFADQFHATAFDQSVIGIKDKYTQSGKVCQPMRKCPLVMDRKSLRPFVRGFWPNLQQIHLHADVLQRAAVRSLRKARWPALQSIHLSIQTLEPHCLELLSEATPSLIKLTVSVSPVSIRTHDAPDLLLTNWCQLQELNLSQTDLHGKAWHLSKHAWPELLALSLPGNELDSQDLQHLLSVPWPKLKRLCLMGNLFDGSFLQQIMQAGLPSIQDLDLRHCTVPRDEWPCNLNIDLPVVQLPCLESLDVGENDLDDLFMAEMQKVWCPLLAHLNAEDSIRFSSAGLHQLVCWPLSPITHLELSCCGVNLAGVKELVEGRWRCLLELDLSYNELDVACVSCLTACYLWPRLQKLHLSHSQRINRRFRSISLRAGCILPLQLLEGSEAIPRWLSAHWPCITCVDLSTPKGV